MFLTKKKLKIVYISIKQINAKIIQLRHAWCDVENIISSTLYGKKIMTEITMNIAFD